MAVKVIVELKARPGRRDELRSLIEQLATHDRPRGYHGSTYYESLDDPTCSSTSPTGSRLKYGRCVSQRPRPPVSMIRCSSCLRGRSGPPSLAGCPEPCVQAAANWRARRASGAHEQHG